MSRVSNDEEVLDELASLIAGRASLVTDQTAAVALLGALTAAAPTFTDTAATPPTPNGAVTFTDADAPTDAEVGEALYELRSSVAAAVTDLGSLRTKLNALITAFTDAGFIAE